MVHFDATLGRYPYTGFRAGGERPIGATPCGTRGIEVVVAGRRYGKGSSREHSVVAELLGRRAAGDRRELRAHLPPERRQRRPLHQHRLRPGRTHRSAARRSRSTSCVPGRDALAAAILRAGGLLRLRPARMQRRSPRPHGAAPTRRRARCSRRSSRATRWRPPTRRRPAHRRRRLRARRPGASSTSTTPACARTCCEQAFGDALALHEPAQHRRLRGPPVLRAPQPGARARRAWSATCVALSRAHRAFVARHRPRARTATCSRSSRPAMTATPARRASRTR